MAVHERSVWDRYATHGLHDLLADFRPPRRSAACDRQSMVTAALDELHPTVRVMLKPGFEIRRRAA